MLKNAKIGVKLSIGFGVLIISMIIITTIAISAFETIEADKSEMVEHNLYVLVAANRIVDEMNIIQRAYLNIGIRTDPAEIHQQQQRGEEALITAMNVIGEMTPHIAIFGEERNYFNSLEMQRTEFQKTKDTLDRMIYAGIEHDEIVEYLLDSFVPTTADFINNIAGFVDFQERLIYSTADEITGEIQRSKRIVITAFVLGLIVALTFAIYITQLITRPINECLNVANHLANGHTDISIDITAKDETGILAQAMQKMVNSIHLMYEDTYYISTEAIAGHLDTRVDVSKHKGDFAKIIKGFNETLSAVSVPIKESMKVMNKLANKDLTARIKGSYNGDFHLLKEDINYAAQTLCESLTQVELAVEQISAASSEISSGSQSLAESTSEQAASIEQISVSLNQINTLTSNNADNAHTGLSLTDVAVKAVDNGNSAMEQMNNAMDCILKSSQETGKIIKTIDEMAFQTNLLALNAAVEAAHAGDAGKGFAVVAEEVKNLASRSAEAARNTNALIEEAGHNSTMGSSIVEQVSRSFIEMKEQFHKVKSIVSEISASSDEQANGIKQINNSISEMRKSTQQNAANAQESASAAEQLTSQASELKSMVCTFQISNQVNKRENASVSKKVNNSLSIEKRTQELLPNSKPKGIEVIPEVILPLDCVDDHDFKDF